MRSTARRTHARRGRATVVTVAGAAAALLGAGTASAATLSTAGHPDSAVTAGGAEQHAVLTSAVKADPKTAAPKAGSWTQVAEKVAKQTSASEPKAASELRPAGTSGPQAWMPISKAQLDNATTIVQQALARKMGVRSAVIAVATSMQEAKLLNIDYGTADSLGLFQQQPDCGWGTAQQVLNPKYSADAFLGALERYQASNPGWGHQPLWQAAQGVQHSAVPFAYAKWEAQAAHLVKRIVTTVK